MTLEQLHNLRPLSYKYDSVEKINAIMSIKRQEPADWKFYRLLAAHYGGIYKKGLGKFHCHFEYNPKTEELKIADIRISDYITEDSVIKRPGMKYYSAERRSYVEWEIEQEKKRVMES
jgi:hypothetical protein